MLRWYSSMSLQLPRDPEKPSVSVCPTHSAIGSAGDCSLRNVHSRGLALAYLLGISFFGAKKCILKESSAHTQCSVYPTMRCSEEALMAHWAIGTAVGLVPPLRTVNIYQKLRHTYEPRKHYFMSRQLLLPCTTSMCLL